MSEAQQQIRVKVIEFLKSRNLKISTDEEKNLGGILSEKYPETYIQMVVAGLEIFIYEDGQSEIRVAGREVVNLEVEDFDSIDQLGHEFLKKLDKVIQNQPC